MNLLYITVYVFGSGNAVTRYGEDTIGMFQVSRCINRD